MGVDYVLVYVLFLWLSFMFGGTLMNWQTPHLYNPTGGSLDISLPSPLHCTWSVQNSLSHNGAPTTLV